MIRTGTEQPSDLQQAQIYSKLKAQNYSSQHYVQSARISHACCNTVDRQEGTP